jgi:predicted amidohydrolase YtcJ
MKISLASSLLLFATAFTISCHSKQPADLIVYHGKIYTVDSSFTITEAMAIKDGKILAVGKDADIRDKFTAAGTIDLDGKAVYPGFIDAHGHFVEYGNSLFTAALYGSTSYEEVVQRVNDFTATHPGLPWIIGRGWDQNKFPGKTFPDNTPLNQLFPTTPVVLVRIDGHAMIANAKALELAAIHPGDKVGGGVVETKNGKLTGILVDNAMDRVYGAIPEPNARQFATEVDSAQRQCFAQGLTTVTEPGIGRRAIEGLDSLQKAGILKMRIYAMVSDNKEDLDYYLPKGPYKTDLLYVKGVKAYADGALGSRGACLLEPYSDKPGWYGFLKSPVAHFDSLAARLAGTDFQLCTHAIGDSGNRMILTVYNKYLKGPNDKRWRIEHAQVIADADFDLFRKTSVIPSVQPTHATSDMYWAGERLGHARIKGAYAFKRLLTENGWLPLGTDFPVEDISPFKTFLAAVFRVDAKGYPAGGFQPENALTREDAIRGMTLWAAKADCLEKEIGSLEPGKQADFIILDHDLMTAGAPEILLTRVVATYSGGKTVYTAPYRKLAENP